MDSAELRNLKDFLLLYNKISEDCFKKCVFNMTQRTLDGSEGDCVLTCASKHVNVNHKTMECFADINPSFQERKAREREEEVRKMQEEAAKLARGEIEFLSTVDKVLGWFQGKGNSNKAVVALPEGQGQVENPAMSQQSSA